MFIDEHSYTTAFDPDGVVPIRAFCFYKDVALSESYLIDWIKYSSVYSI